MDSRNEKVALDDEKFSVPVVINLQKMAEHLADPVDIPYFSEQAVTLVGCGHCINQDTAAQLKQCPVCRAPYSTVLPAFTVRSIVKEIKQINLQEIEQVYLENKASKTKMVELKEENEKIKEELAEYKRENMKKTIEFYKKINAVLSDAVLLAKKNKDLEEKVRQLEHSNTHNQILLERFHVAAEENNQIISETMNFQQPARIFAAAERERAASEPLPANRPMYCGTRSLFNKYAQQDSAARQARQCCFFWPSLLQGHYDTPHSSVLHPPSASR